VRKLLDLGVDYKGSLSEAKSTINRFLRNDCRQLGVIEIGNGNNRNITDRLEPILQKECLKYSLPDHGDYYQLRVRLKDKKPFNSFIPFDDPISITTEWKVIEAGQAEKKSKPAKKAKERAVE